MEETMSPAARPWRRMCGEAAAIRDAVRAMSRRTVVTESVLAGLVLLCALAPIALIPPAHPVTAVLVGCWRRCSCPRGGVAGPRGAVLRAGGRRGQRVGGGGGAVRRVVRRAPHRSRTARLGWLGRAPPAPCSRRWPPSPSADSRRCRTWLPTPA
ncbi:hypothetical protein NKH18_24775 [Streptomyces sp. M10(2022)]